MALSNLFGWSETIESGPASSCGSACGAADKPAEKPSACGSAFLILNVPSSTEFSLTYSGSGMGRDGQITLTIFKLRRS